MLYKNVANQTIVFLTRSMVTGEGVVALTPTVSKDGGAFSAAANSTAYIGNGWHKLLLSQSETNCDVLSVASSDPLIQEVALQYRPFDKTLFALATDVATINGKLDAIDDFVDTEVASIASTTSDTNTRARNIESAVITEVADTLALATAIKAKTDNLPSDPADASVIAGLLAAINSNVDVSEAAIIAEVDASETAILAAIAGIPGGPGGGTVIIDVATATAVQTAQLSKITVTQFSGRPVVNITVTQKDAAGLEQPYDLSGKDLRFVLFDQNENDETAITIIKQLDTPLTGFTTSSNVVAINLDSFPEMTAIAGRLRWILWELDASGDMELGRGIWDIRPSVIGT